MNELFTIEPVKSPRLQWMERHGIKTHCMPALIDKPWMAWLVGDEDLSGLPIKDFCGYGMLEGDALVDLARKSGLKLWNEENDKDLARRALGSE